MAKLDKLILNSLVLLLSFLSITSNNIKAGLKTVSKMKAHLKAMIKLKSQNLEFLNNLMTASYSNNNNSIKDEASKISSNKSTTPTLKKKFFRLSPNSLKKRFSEVPLEEKDQEVYEQYRYKTYSKIVNHIFELEKKYPNLIKISVAQERYNLPYPGGRCDNGNHKEK